jgi:hypothetical protein
MKLIARSTLLTTLALLLVGVANAHHSFAAEFLADETATFHGVVTEVWFKNPHVRYYIEIANEDGSKEAWDIRASSPALLVRKGWSKNTIKEGDEITVTGFLGRDERKILSVQTIELADGTILGQSY